MIVYRQILVGKQLKKQRFLVPVYKYPKMMKRAMFDLTRTAAYLF